MEDEAIVRLFFAREEAAITEAQNKHGRICMAVARRILPDERDVEECVSDACLRAWNAIPPDMPRSLSAYLARITRNLALDRRSYNQAEKRSTALECAFEELEPWLRAENTPEKALEGAELRRFLNGFLRSEAREARTFFLRRYWYGESIREIAEDCGCSEAKVKSSLFRTRTHLREAMDKEEITL